MSDTTELFDWNGYLEHTSASAAPSIAFSHVENSLENIFKKDMVMEIVSKREEASSPVPIRGRKRKSPPFSEPTCHYWPATVVMACGPLVGLRFVGYTDRQHDIWLNTMKKEFHMLNWAKENGKILSPPEDLKDIVGSNVDAFLNEHLKHAESISKDLVELGKMGTCPSEFINTDTVVEVQDKMDLSVVWIAKVVKNIGGRLLLRYLGSKSTNNDFWLFYLSHRIHPINWAQIKKIIYKPPQSISKTPELINALSEAMKEKTISPSILEPQIEIPMNPGFGLGMGLEIVHPVNFQSIYPATVVKVDSYHYFQVQLHDNQGTLLSCHQGMSTILPAKWSQANMSPLKCSKDNFTWENYVKERGKSLAPSPLFNRDFINPGFEVDMKLECFHPLKPNEAYVATIIRIMEPLMLVEMDLTQEQFIFPFDSLELFPEGWNTTNNCVLNAPKWEQPKPIIQIPSPIEKPENRSKSLKIYINSLCFSGNNLNKGKLAGLPKQLGPGQMALVLVETITKIINAAYKPSAMLKDLLEMKWDPHFEMEKKRIIVKCSGKTHEGMINIVRNPEQIEEFCKEFCLHFNCCPHLFGPQVPSKECPENCSKNKKSKFGNHYRKSNRKGLKRGPKPNSIKKEPTIIESKKENTPLPEPSRMVTRQSGPSNNSTPFHSLVEKYQAKKDLPKAHKYSWHKQKFNKISTPLPPQRGRPKGSTKRASSEENLAPVIKLPSNPLHWTVDNVYDYILTTECSPLAHWFKDNAFDGKALLSVSKPQLVICETFNERGIKLLTQTIINIRLSYYYYYDKKRFKFE